MDSRDAALSSPGHGCEDGIDGIISSSSGVAVPLFFCRDGGMDGDLAERKHIVTTETSIGESIHHSMQAPIAIASMQMQEFFLTIAMAG